MVQGPEHVLQQGRIAAPHPLMEEKRQDVRQEKLGVPAETAIGLIERAGPRARGAFTGVLPATGGAGGSRFGQLPKLAADAIRVPQDAFAVVAPFLHQGLHHGHETRRPVFRLGCQIPRGEERNQVGRQEDLPYDSIIGRDNLLWLIQSTMT